MAALKQLIMVLVVVTVMMTSTAKFSDFKSAFDAAFVRLIADGTYQALQAGDSTALTVSDCVATPSFYPYPAAPTGALQAALARKSVNLGTPSTGGNAYFSASPGTTPTGWGSELVKKIFALISANYGVPLSINWVYFSTSPDTFTALQNGQVDAVIPFFSLGAFFNGSRRNEVFETTCSLTASSTSIYVKTGVFSSLTDIKAAALTRPLKVSTSGAGSVAAAAAFFPATAVVTDVSLLTSVPADRSTQYVFDSVRSGMYDLAFDIDPETAAQVTGLTKIDSGIISPAGGFFRREPAPTPCSSGSNTVNINFAGILAGR